MFLQTTDTSKVGIYTEHRIWHSHDMLISSLSQWEVEVEVGMVVALLQASNAAVRRPTTGRLRGEISSHLSIDKTRCLVKSSAVFMKTRKVGYFKPNHNVFLTIRMFVPKPK